MSLLSLVVFAVGFGMLAGGAVLYSRATKVVDLANPEVLLENWIQQAASLETKQGLHQHIVKHANELVAEIEGNGTYETWSASMHNLLRIYDTFHGVEPDVDLKLERMTAKYISGTGGSPPPSPLPERIVKGAQGPVIEKRREAEKKERASRLQWGSY